MPRSRTSERAAPTSASVRAAVLLALLSVGCLREGIAQGTSHDEDAVTVLERIVRSDLGSTSEQRFEPLEPSVEPLPEPALAPADITALLNDAEQTLRELKVHGEPQLEPGGPLPAASGLPAAYHERRAFALAGKLEHVRGWMAAAKRSALARYDLVVTRDDDDAWLHVVVPAAGLGERGRHEAWIEGERWLNLADLIEPGRHYVPYKSNGEESLDRQWARADVLADLVTIADEYRQRTGVLLGIGDLSHVTGGKIDDHWTHREGVDADLYLLDHQAEDREGRPRVWWHHFNRARELSIWSSKPKGKGQHEPRLDPDDELSDTPTSQRLRVLAQIVFPIDAIAYFVHDDPRVLSSFDQQVGERRPGRRYLHAQNRGLWPRHCDHVHLRWVEGELPVGETPRP